MKKIAVIGLKGLPAYGGAATVGENIIEQLKDKFDFTVYSISSHTSIKTGKYNNICYQIVFKALPWKKLNSLLYYIRATFHVMLFSNYDLVHLHHRDAAFIIPFLKLRYKVILTTHRIFNIEKLDKWKNYFWYFRIQEKFFVKKANIITGITKSDIKRMQEKLNLNACYIPNGINPISLSIKQIPYNSYIYFASGRILRSKGCHILINALEKIKYQDLLVISGDLEHERKYKNELFNMINNLNVHFTGLIKDKNLLYNYINQAKLFIFPSNVEGMSIMLLEVVAMKTPIIASNIEENIDIFNEEEILFFEVDNDKDLAEKITYALNNCDIMQKKADNAYKKLYKEYLWRDISKSYAELYDTLLKDKK